MISAIVLAAGLSTRMGVQKLLQPIDGEPMLGRTLKALRRPSIDETVVVLGAEASRVREGIKFERERVIVNGSFEEGMSSSLRLGLKSVNPRTDAAIIALGDQPFVSPEVIDRVVGGYLAKKPPIVVPVYGGVRGNPVLFARSVFPDVLKVRGDFGAKSVVQAYGDRVLEVPVDDEGVLFDIDTPADYERAVALSRTARRRTGREGSSQRPGPRRRSG